MTKILTASIFSLLLLSGLEAKEDHQVGFKAGLTSIDNEGGWSFEKGTFFTDLTFDIPFVIKPRIDLGYISIDEKDKGSVSALLQVAANGIYDIDLSSYYQSALTPYLLGGLGYEHVFDETPVFKSHPFIQAGIGAKYPITDRITLAAEFRALQMFDNNKNDEDNEFALMFGIQIPLFVDVIRAPLEPTEHPNIETPQPAIQQTLLAEVIDNDQDGIADTVDKCPNTPQGYDVDASGCMKGKIIVIPEEVAYLEDGIKDQSASVSRQKREVFNPKAAKRQNLQVNFESNSATIDAASKNGIKMFAAYLKAHPSQKVTIEGYTDNSGSRAQNIRLSGKRAEAVKNLLITYGVEANRLKSIGKGDLNPIANNETQSGRSENRRIEAVLHK